MNRLIHLDSAPVGLITKADDKALDGDVILAAQAMSVKINVREVIVATSNLKHLSLFVDASFWQDI
jgi:hypothetical protein